MTSKIHAFTERELAQEMAMLEKSQQLAGHFPSEEAIERARNAMIGELSFEDA